MGYNCPVSRVFDSQRVTGDIIAGFSQMTDCVIAGFSVRIVTTIFHLSLQYLSCVTAALQNHSHQIGYSNYEDQATRNIKIEAFLLVSFCRVLLGAFQLYNCGKKVESDSLVSAYNSF